MNGYKEHKAFCDETLKSIFEELDLAKRIVAERIQNPTPENLKSLVSLVEILTNAIDYNVGANGDNFDDYATFELADTIETILDDVRKI